MLVSLFVAGSLLGFALLVFDTLDLRARAADLARCCAPTESTEVRRVHRRVCSSRLVVDEGPAPVKGSAVLRP